MMKRGYNAQPILILIDRTIFRWKTKKNCVLLC